MSNFIAIDPGRNGGIAFYLNNKLNEVAKMPIKNKVVDVINVANLFFWAFADKIIIEDIFLMSKQGGNKTIGMNYGRIFAIAELLHIPIEIVRPQVWQKVMLPGIKGRDNLKPAGIDLVHKLYPDRLPKLGKTDRSKKYHDGCADAILIGEWYKKQQ